MTTISKEVVERLRDAVETAELQPGKIQFYSDEDNAIALADLRALLDAIEARSEQEETAVERDGANPEKDRYGWKHHWDRFDRPRTCVNCSYEQHDGSGNGYYECPANPAATPDTNANGRAEDRGDRVEEARAIWAAELRATAPKGEYVARTFEEGPSSHDERIVRAIETALKARPVDVGHGEGCANFAADLAKEAVAAERERCAKIAEQHYTRAYLPGSPRVKAGNEIAATIRSVEPTEGRG